MDYTKNELLGELSRYPLFSQALGPSLQIRINKPNWFENRLIQVILKDISGIEEYERLMEEAAIKKVTNGGEIFTQLKGQARDYDLTLFDVLAEVRLIRWARENGYTSIKKLIPSRAKSKSKTPDFIMEKDGETTIAEAKHFRWRDYLSDFVEDRLNGLVWKTGCLARFGISVETTDKYEQMREFFLKTRLRCEREYQEVIREELKEEWLRQLECNLDKNPNLEPEIFLGLFGVRRDNNFRGASVRLFGPHKNERDAAELMLEKLCGNLLKALKQIKSFIDANSSREIHSRALVFLSGTGSWSKEWDDMWEMLERNDDTVWEKVTAIHHKASEMIKLPFELIVGKDKKERTTFAGHPAIKRTLEYIPFSWTPAS